jgi:RNA polymerase sigma-70 factor (ECF subfamily)
MNQSDFQRLIELYGQGIYRYVKRMIGESMAEDLTQDVFMKAISAERKPEAGAEKSWLYAIASNLCIDYLRSNDYDKKRKGRWAINAAPSSRPPEELLAEVEDRERLARALEELPDKQKEVLMLKVEGGFTFAEVAKILKEPPDTVAARMYAAINTLRQVLRREEVR